MSVSNSSLSNEKRQMEVPVATSPQTMTPSISGAPMYGVAQPTAAPFVAQQANAFANQVPQTLQSAYYTAGYLRRFIGRTVRVEFLIGTNGPLVDRIGTLLEVGASYIVLRLYMTNDIIICDLYSIKFVTVYGYGSGISNYAG